MKTITLFIKDSFKSIYLVFLLTGLLSLTTKSMAQTTTVDFDDISGGQSPLNGTYKGLSWGYPAYTLNGPSYGVSCAGYVYGTVSGSRVAYNAGGSYPWTISYASSGTITFVSVYLTAAWNTGLTIKIEGLNGTTVMNTQQLTLSPTVPTLVNMNWSNLTSIKISLVSAGSSSGCSGGGDHIVMDNLVYNSCTPSSVSSISVSPNSATNTGGVNTNLYIGYPTNNPSVTLTANTSGTVTWSPATNLSCSTCTTTVFSPTAAGNYTFTAANCGGSSKTVTICVKDIRVPNTSGTKAAVYMCHKEPVANTTKTLAVLLRGIPGHFQYHSGDKLGVCGNTCAASKRDFDYENLVVDEQYLEVMCSPNPFRQSFKLHYISNSEVEATVAIYGMTGNLVETVTLEGVADEAELGTNLPNGIYTVSFIQGDKNRVFRMIKVD